MSIQFKAELSGKVPGSLNVYRLAPPKVLPRAVAGVAKLLGLSGKAPDYRLSEDWISYLEGRHLVSVHRVSGAVRFRHRDKYGVETDQAYDLDPREATRIALAFLKRTGVVPLKEAIFHRVTHLRSGTGDVQSGRREEKLLDAGVIYRRTVDGIEVNGPGGFAMVNISPEKEVVGLSSVWRPLGKRAAKVKLISPERALATIRELARGLYGDTIVTKASLGYFELGELDRQVYLQPAYCFVYEVRNGDVVHKSIEVIPAGEKTFARLIGGKRFPSDPQPRRKGPPRRPREDSVGQAVEVSAKRVVMKSPVAVR
jgi:hypothetical protein